MLKAIWSRLKSDCSLPADLKKVDSFKILQQLYRAFKGIAHEFGYDWGDFTGDEFDYDHGDEEFAWADGAGDQKSAADRGSTGGGNATSSNMIDDEKIVDNMPDLRWVSSARSRANG